MALHESMDRAVQVLFGIGMPVVLAVVGGPPQRSALRAGSADEREQHFHPRVGLEGFMREIAVVEAGDGEHAQTIGQQQGDQCRPRKADPEHRNTAEMQADER